MIAKRYIMYTILIAIIAGFDQWSKTFLITYLKTQPGYYIEVAEFLDIVYAWNYGASFGFLRQYYQYSNYFFIGLNSVIVGILIWTLTKSDDNRGNIAFSMIIGGALGNIIDRILRGAVFDFIYIHYDDLNFHFPAFNIADSFITIGAIFYFYNYYFVRKPTPKTEEK